MILVRRTRLRAALNWDFNLLPEKFRQTATLGLPLTLAAFPIIDTSRTMQLQDFILIGLMGRKFINRTILINQKGGPGATILNMLIKEVYNPIGANHFATGTGYTKSGAVGFPFSAWGVLPTIDQLAKAGRLIANKGKTKWGKQILSRSLIEDFFTNDEYQYAFWKTTFVNDAGEAFYIPTMSGAGGNYVFSMPNGLVGIALGCNSYNFGWTDAQKLTVVEAANNLNSF